MSSFPVIFSFQGKTVTLSNVTTLTTAQELYHQALEALQLSDEKAQVKLLLKGKRISKDGCDPVFSEVPTNNKPPKLIVLATSAVVAQEIASKKSDPTIRGFDQESLTKAKSQQPQHWGDGMQQDKNYKFCRFQACTWQSFGHRPCESTPHDFAARELLDRLATDPGVVAVMKERELVVGTLGEMDPIDDRIMQKKQQQVRGACLLGYNTNGGTRIDIKLRTDDLQDFRPYPELMATLLHELSHNWVGEHNLLFWTNYAQMRAEYLYTHARLRSTANLVKGKTTAELAGLDKAKLENVFAFIMHELVREMGQHGLHPNMIAEPIRQRIQELEASYSSGQRLGGGGGNDSGNVSTDGGGGSARERALAAAERRERRHQDRGKKS